MFGRNRKETRNETNGLTQLCCFVRIIMFRVLLAGSCLKGQTDIRIEWEGARLIVDNICTQLSNDATSEKKTKNVRNERIEILRRGSHLMRT